MANQEHGWGHRKICARICELVKMTQIEKGELTLGMNTQCDL